MSRRPSRGTAQRVSYVESDPEENYSDDEEGPIQKPRAKKQAAKSVVATADDDDDEEENEQVPKPRAKKQTKRVADDDDDDDGGGGGGGGGSYSDVEDEPVRKPRVKKRATKVVVDDDAEILDDAPTESPKIANVDSLLTELDVTGRKRKFLDISIQELTDYCKFANHEFECTSAVQISNFFSSRYGWDTTARLADITLAWSKVEAALNKEGEGKGKGAAEAEAKTKPKSSRKAVALTDTSSSIPVAIKSSSVNENVLFCQLDDLDLHFSGDSGAIGRFFCDPDTIRLDLKGRQYKGILTSGPTVMVLNLSNNQIAKAETITNEFCHLTFEQDQHSSFQGVYTGAGGSATGAGLNYDDTAGNSAALRRMSSKGTQDPDGDGGGVGIAKPKISTITNKKRKTSSKKSTTAKKKPKK